MGYGDLEDVQEEGFCPECGRDLSLPYTPSLLDCPECIEREEERDS